VGFVGQQELYMVRHQATQRAQQAGPQPMGYGPPLGPVLQPVEVESDRPVRVPQPRLPEPDLNNPFPAVAFLGGRQTPREPNFSGFLWDPDYQIWVCWHEGRPVAAYWARAL
jgi:hypothetical protein